MRLLAAAAADQGQEAALAVEVLLVDLQVLGQVVDARCEASYLNICAPRVGVVQLEFFQICGCISHCPYEKEASP